LLEAGEDTNGKAALGKAEELKSRWGIEDITTPGDPGVKAKMGVEGLYLSGLLMANMPGAESVPPVDENSLAIMMIGMAGVYGWEQVKEWAWAFQLKLPSVIRFLIAAAMTRVSRRSAASIMEGLGQQNLEADKIEEARVLYVMQQHQLMLAGEFEEAVHAHFRWLDLLEGLPEDSPVGTTASLAYDDSIRLADQIEEEGQLELALQVHERARQFAEKQGWTSHQEVKNLADASLLRIRGAVAYDEGNYEESVHYFEQAAASLTAYGTGALVLAFDEMSRAEIEEVLNRGRTKVAEQYPLALENLVRQKMEANEEISDDFIHRVLRLAIEQLQEALRGYRQTPLGGGWMHHLIDYRHMLRYINAAVATIRPLEQVVRSQSSRRDIIGIYTLQGQVLEEMDLDAEAQAAYQKAFALQRLWGFSEAPVETPLLSQFRSAGGSTTEVTPEGANVITVDSPDTSDATKAHAGNFFVGDLTVVDGSQARQEDAMFVLGNAEVFIDETAALKLDPEDWEDQIAALTTWAHDHGLTEVAHYLDLADEGEIEELYSDADDVYLHLREEGLETLAFRLIESEVTLTQEEIILLHAAITVGSLTELVPLIDSIIKTGDASVTGQQPLIIGPAPNGILRANSVLRVIR